MSNNSQGRKSPGDGGVLRRTVHNPEFPRDRSVAAALAARADIHDRLLALRNEPDLDPDSARQLIEAKASIVADLPGFGGEFAPLREALSTVTDAKSARVTAALKARLIETQKVLDGDGPSIPFPVPLESPPKDHSFWLSHYDVYEPTDGAAGSAQDGWHYVGGPQVKDSLELNRCFGLVGWFALQPARMPPRITGRYTSSPQARIGGRVVGYAPDPPMHPYFGDGHARCDLQIKQTLFQIDVDKPYYLEIDSKAEGRVLIDERNSAVLRFKDLDGLTNVPHISFDERQFHKRLDLWARIEIRFDVSLRWPGALLICAPQVVLRTLQWPLIAS